MVVYNTKAMCISPVKIRNISPRQTENLALMCGIAALSFKERSLLRSPRRSRRRLWKIAKQRDVSQFILPESLRVLSVPDERSDESHLSGPPLNYQPAQSGILQQPLTMAIWALFSTASKSLSDRDTGKKKKKQCSSKSGVKATQHSEFKTLVHYF